MQTITVRTKDREELVEITGKVADMVARSGSSEGVCVLFTQHTTCGLTINENADPDVKTDLLRFLRDRIPQHYEAFRHYEENSDAHIKSSLMGSNVTVPFSGGKLLLGRWQGIYLCEFDGPRERSVVVVIR